MPKPFSHASFHGLIGVGQVEITPSPGIYCRNWGAAKHDVADGVHRPLLLNAMVLQSKLDAQPLILIDADLGWWANLQFERKFRQQLIAELGIEEARLLFALSHTHSAPPLTEPEPSWAGGDLLRQFLDTLPEKTLQAIALAKTNLQAATLEWHVGQCSLATNRDLPDPSGQDRSRIVCGYRPEAAADKTLIVGRATNESGKVMATISNYACHPTTLAWDNTKISPDYLGAFRETVSQHAHGAVAFFLQGASGELSPRFQYVGDVSVADAHGRQLAYATLATLEDMEPPKTMLTYRDVVQSGAPLAVWARSPKDDGADAMTTSLQAVCRHVPLPLKNWPSASQLEKEYQACPDRALAERLRRKLRIRQAIGDGETFNLELWGWRIGQCIVLGTMGEVYSTLQQQIRKAYPNLIVIWINLVNGSIGYLPPEELYDSDVYQVWQTPFDRSSMEKLQSAACELIDELNMLGDD